MTGQPTHDAAQGLAAAGWPVLPLAGKVPRTPAGFKDASTDRDVVAGWWRRWPGANVGIAIPVDLLVLDVDPRNGGTLADLAQHGRLPATLTAESGRRDGGRHFYLGRPNGPLNGTRLPQGWDLKVGGRGYCVAPPSRHPATGLPYRWVDRSPIAPCPRWLADLLAPPRVTVPPPRARPGGSGDGLVRTVAAAQQGNRNAALFWASCRAAENGHLAELAEALVSAAVSAGLPESEARQTIASAARRRAA